MFNTKEIQIEACHEFSRHEYEVSESNEISFCN